MSMTRSPDAPVPPDQAQHARQCLTTEHFVLQNARAATIQEANQRADLFLTSVSSATIALSFVAQMGRPFVLFATCILVLRRYHSRAWAAAEESLPARFLGDNGNSES
ncbi:hypothetical protein NKI19_05585 [Mesorhizobium sp. M0751]|uniref:hypothetical protein n=1 Tax=unclassified Mesorhizobium TaxID=325217 RepID=UPI0033357065